MKCIHKPLNFLYGTVLAGVTLLSSAAFGASSCNGMPQDACAAADTCTWIQGYLRKDGRSVSSHCKSKGAGKAGGQTKSEGTTLGRAK